jgi:hypothetical protein
MKYILLVTIVFLTNLLFGQTSGTTMDCLTIFDTVSNRTIYTTTDTMPEYPGGIDSMSNFINSNLHWPDDGVNIQGAVYISFIVEMDGNLTNKRILRGFYKNADKESLRIVDKMPKWKSGKCKGVAVPVRCIIPIKFVSQKK